MRAVPKILSLYHYYHPDDVAGAQQFTGFCEGMASRGIAEPNGDASASSGILARHTQGDLLGSRASEKWTVEVWPSNRNCHNPKAKYPLKVEELNGVKIRRVWRSAWQQHSNLGRILSALWMMKLWFWRFLLSPGGRPDILVIGTDPIFCLGIVPFLKLIHPKMKVVHWCFDLYPEYAIANGMARKDDLIAGILGRWMEMGYRRCDLVADIGSCMKERLKRYNLGNCETLTPWALEEPFEPLAVDNGERKELFADALLALLYSGNFGLPHEFYLTLKLARAMKRDGAVLCYSAHGSRLEALQKALNPEDVNVRFVPFAPQEKLAARLSSPDVHVVSLRTPWTGLLVPSKFFGALAVGRPVLFEGDDDSSIARWIREYGVGWVLNHDNVEQVRTELLNFSKSAKKKEEMFRRCHSAYQALFSRKSVMDKWDQELKALLV